jgi:hypothetical protein
MNSSNQLQILIHLIPINQITSNQISASANAIELRFIG